MKKLTGTILKFAALTAMYSTLTWCARGYATPATILGDGMVVALGMIVVRGAHAAAKEE